MGSMQSPTFHSPRHRSAFGWKRGGLLSLLITLWILTLPGEASAARVGDLSSLSFWEQATRFFSFQDPAVRYAILGSVLLGLCSGVLGSFIVVRKLALVGDALSHAVLPGVALGFLWNMSKDPWAIFFGACRSCLAS